MGNDRSNKSQHAQKGFCFNNLGKVTPKKIHSRAGNAKVNGKNDVAVIRTCPRFYASPGYM